MGTISAHYAREWSLSQLEDKLREIKSEHCNIEAKREKLGREFDTNPGRWGGNEPVGLSSWALLLDRLEEDIALLESLISSKS